MKMKDLLSISENKNNKQINASLRKKKFIKAGMSVEEFLNMTIINKK